MTGHWSYTQYNDLLHFYKVAFVGYRILAVREYGTCCVTEYPLRDETRELDHTFDDVESVQLLFVLRIV